jgi:prepilin-type N-terminal cleavage/methylation domain-containing protein
MPSFNNRGFTLLELLIVVSLTVVLMLGASALFLTFLVSNTKGNALQRVNEEGEYAISQMEFLIRNAIEILPNSADQTCEANMDEFVIRSVDTGTTTFFAETVDGTTKIASNSGIYLTSGAAELVAGPEFDCSTTENGGTQHVTVQFTLRKGTPGIDQDKEIVEQSFQTGVTVRSF